MLESAELGHKLKKKEYQQLVPELRAALLQLQIQLDDADFPVLIALEGDDRIGVRQAINAASRWLDPRFLGVESYISTERAQAEDEYPFYWRYWLRMPGRGRMAIMSNAWTARAIQEQVLLEKRDEALLERRVRHIVRFEEELVRDGMLLVKIWLHVPDSELKKQLKKADADPTTRWQLTDQDRTLYAKRDALRSVSEFVIQQTSTGAAPWTIVESSDTRYRDVQVGTLLRDALKARLDRAASEEPPPPAAPAAPAAENGLPTKTLLDTIDLSVSTSEEKYDKHMKHWQSELSRLSRECFDRSISSVLVFQGWDAAGKGGTIRRISSAVDASICRVMSIAAPTDEERAHHYLWRFWRRLPRAGRVRIFDRSWYERVLVERVEGLASEAEWRRAYSEIRDFEEQLCEHGVVLLKFWLHIDPDEQLRRFEDRERTPFKNHKITQDDYRNRERRSEYEAAVNEMIARTQHPNAPWHLIAANDKRHARVEVLKIVCEALERALERSG